jgi:hypothetical protein
MALPFGSGTDEFKIEENRHIISQGSADNFDARVSIVITINANGDETEGHVSLAPISHHRKDKREFGSFVGPFCGAYEGRV